MLPPLNFGDALSLAAIDGGQVVGLIILVISVLSGVVNAVKSNKGKLEERGFVVPDKAGRKKATRLEIDEFLEELTGGPSQAEIDRERIERKRQKKERKSQRQREGRERQQSPPVPRLDTKPRASVWDAPAPQPAATPSRIGSGNLGEGLRQHVSSYMAEERLGADKPGLQHLTTALTASSAAVAQPSDTSARSANDARQELLQLLRDPRGIRQAMIVQELLQKPVALRR